MGTAGHGRSVQMPSRYKIDWDIWRALGQMGENGPFLEQKRWTAGGRDRLPLAYAANDVTITTPLRHRDRRLGYCDAEVISHAFTTAARRRAPSHHRCRRQSANENTGDVGGNGR